MLEHPISITELAISADRIAGSPSRDAGLPAHVDPAAGDALLQQVVVSSPLDASVNAFLIELGARRIRGSAACESMVRDAPRGRTGRAVALKCRRARTRIIDSTRDTGLPSVGMQLRTEQSHDHAAVRDIHLRAFGASGATVATLVDALRVADPAALGLIAELAGEVVGHVMFSRSLLDAPSRLLPVQVLSPLGVRPDHQRRGIGSALVRYGLQRLDERGVPLVFVEGDPRYYARLGFAPGAARSFRKPSLRIPDDAFQVVALTAYEPWMTGTLVYSDTFWIHDCVGLRDP